MSFLCRYILGDFMLICNDYINDYRICYTYLTYLFISLKEDSHTATRVSLHYVIVVAIELNENWYVEKPSKKKML